MTLVKCKECGEKISKKATACPQCGAPPKKKTSLFTWLVVVFVGLVVVGVANQPPASAPAAPVVLTPEQKQAREAALVGELQGIPAVEVKKNLAAYRELVTLNPGNEKYPAKVAYYEGQLVRYEQIQGQFSAWSGAHKSIERYVKQQLKDPDSYEHIETGYNDNGDHLLVITKYRAKNSFGGFAVETVQARCTIAGDCKVF